MKLAVFDVDGTLNETERYAVRAYRETLLAVGRPAPPDARILALFGEPPQRIEDVLLRGCGPQVRGEFARLIVKKESELMRKYGKAYDGTAEMLRELRQKGIRTAVCSNTTAEHIRSVLSAIRLTDLIDYSQPLEGGGTKTDSLRCLLKKTRPEAACMVGDRRFDKKAARDNGIPFVGCLYGYGRDEVLDADFVADSPREVLRGVLRLLGQAPQNGT
ncbi:MAG TPA: HAD family hydrolase [Ruminococcaceae bacterium]|jgi:phosphoglycolate phosphatase|nr:HAD family hydrolase [Oscillospiraceae bacterium]